MVSWTRALIRMSASASATLRTCSIDARSSSFAASRSRLTLSKRALVATSSVTSSAITRSHGVLRSRALSRTKRQVIPLSTSTSSRSSATSRARPSRLCHRPWASARSVDNPMRFRTSRMASFMKSTSHPWFIHMTPSGRASSASMRESRVTDALLLRSSSASTARTRAVKNDTSAISSSEAPSPTAAMAGGVQQARRATSASIQGRRRQAAQTAPSTAARAFAQSSDSTPRSTGCSHRRIAPWFSMAEFETAHTKSRWTASMASYQTRSQRNLPSRRTVAKHVWMV